MASNNNTGQFIKIQHTLRQSRGGRSGGRGNRAEPDFATCAEQKPA
jgi:hypothetical protein